jgi:EAL and modified HD-GYP domain-containing signal transduction protein
VPLVEYVIVRVSLTDPRRVRDIGETAAQVRLQGAPAGTRCPPALKTFSLHSMRARVSSKADSSPVAKTGVANKVGPNTARIADLLGRLRRDADIREIADVIKHDPGLSVRLMRYMNSASIGLRQEVTSIERALLQLGRDKLYRWLMLLIYGADKGSARSSALLESALVRARMMELLGENRPPKEREALFLVGLLSLVDAVLQVPMADAMSQLAVATGNRSGCAAWRGPYGGTCCNSPSPARPMMSNTWQPMRRNAE